MLSESASNIGVANILEFMMPYNRRFRCEWLFAKYHKMNGSDKESSAKKVTIIS